MKKKKKKKCFGIGESIGKGKLHCESVRDEMRTVAGGDESW